jgi:predicted phage baseplate assembly protein
VTAQIEQLTPPCQGIPPDQVHVNTTPVDFTRDFHPLGENPRVGDTFYVASTEALSKVEATLRPEERSRVELAVDINITDASLRWEFFGGAQGSLTWIPLKEGEVNDQTHSFTHDGRIGPMLLSQPVPVRIQLSQEHSVSVLFFRVSIATGTYYKVPCLRAFQVTVRTPSAERRGAPIIAFISETPLEVVNSNGTTVDLTGLTLLDVREPFYPFGLTPIVENTFYFGIPSTESPDVRPDEPLVLLTPQTSRLIWEFLSLDGWKRLGESSTREQIIGPTDYEFLDATLAFTRAALVSFRRPHDLARGEVNGQANYWIRARLASGYYGRPLEFIPVNPTDPSKGFKPRPGTGAPNAPVVSSIRLNYSAQNPSPLVVTHNQFVLEDRTDANKTANTSFKPFEAVEEKEPTFYLGFDQPLPNNAITLYFVVPPRQFVEKLKTDVAENDTNDPNGGDPRLLWEYWNGREWARLVIADETKGFTESGSVQFLGPTDLAALAKFDPPSRYWLRVRLLERTEDYAPLLSGVFLNAVRVVQATTLRDELLGSSSGRKNQVFRLSRRPVFPGQRLEVREPERPSAEEEADITAEEGKEAIQTTDGPDGARQIWVRWHEVKSLNRSGSRSRHYTIDRITGEVRFGDGVRGLIPPEGRDNIVCKAYRAGGGAAGNQVAGALSQLKTSIPYIASVTNPIAADGGSDAETVQAVQERGPQTLKHRSRAVAAEDFEWLGRQAAGTRVARARCLPNRNRDLDFEPGWATLIIVPSGTEKKLLPSAELVREVEDDLATRSLATLTTLTHAHINVIGPGYVPVEVAVEVMPIELTQADAVRKAVLDALERFCHPLTGGPAGEGWEFGRDVYLSELFAAFENLPGVEHVHSLSFKPTVATVPLQFTPATDRACLVGTAVTVAIDGSTLRARLVEPLPVGASDAMVTMFREGERVTLMPREGGTAQAVEITVRGISGNILTVDPFRAQLPFAAGSEVVSVDGASATFLITPIPQGTRVSILTVQGFAPGQSVRLAGDGPFALKVIGDAPNQHLDLGQRLRVPEFYLVYSGAHTVDISPI